MDVILWSPWDGFILYKLGPDALQSPAVCQCLGETAAKLERN